jgi:hypothetical protein
VARKNIKPLIYVAVFIGAAMMAYFFFNEQNEVEVADGSKVVESPVLVQPLDEKPVKAESHSPEVNTSAPPEVKATAPFKEDPLVTRQKDFLESFKEKIKLKINLPSDLTFQEIQLEGEVAAMYGSSPGKDRSMAILAAERTASPETIAEYLRDQKHRIPLLNKHDFQINGELRVMPGPKGSGITRITVIPGGQSNGEVVYAAHLERGDAKGSYILLMKASENYFEKYEGDFDTMLESLSVRN